MEDDECLPRYHATQRQIEERLEDVVAKFDIPAEKITAVVHENGANVVAAANIWRRSLDRPVSAALDVDGSLFFSSYS